MARTKPKTSMDATIAGMARSENPVPYGAEIVRLPTALADFPTDALIAELKRRFPHEHRGPIGGPQGAIDSVRLHLSAISAGAEREHFGVLFLDTRHHLIAIEELFAGAIDSCTVVPRVIVQRAFQLNAASVVLYHNHPSGNAEPSQADQSLTRRIAESLALLDIRVLDHIVIGAPGVVGVSFAERGWL